MLSKHCFHQVSRRALSFGTRNSNLKGALASAADASRLASVSSHQEVSSSRQEVSSSSSSSSLHFYSSITNRHVKSTLTPFIPTVDKNEDVLLKRYLSTTASASLDPNEKKEEQIGFKKLSPELEQLLRSEFEVRLLK